MTQPVHSRYAPDPKLCPNVVSIHPTQHQTVKLSRLVNSLLCETSILRPYRILSYGLDSLQFNLFHKISFSPPIGR